MFATATNLGPGMCLAFPDVCNTPTPAGPVPVPYPNIAMGAQANPGSASKKVFVSAGQTMTLKTLITMSNGDQAGSAGGVISGMIMGPARYTTGSFTLLTEGMPTARWLSTTTQNGMAPNAPMGAQLVPSQVKVFLLP